MELEPAPRAGFVLSVKPLELRFGLIFFWYNSDHGKKQTLILFEAFSLIGSSPSAVLPFNKKCSRLGEFLVHPKASAGPGPRATPGVSCSSHNPTATS